MTRVTCACGWTRTYPTRARAEANARRHRCPADRTRGVRRATRSYRCKRCGLEAVYENAGAAEARYWFSKHSCRKHEQATLRHALAQARLAERGDTLAQIADALGISRAGASKLLNYQPHRTHTDHQKEAV